MFIVYNKRDAFRNRFHLNKRNHIKRETINKGSVLEVLVTHSLLQGLEEWGAKIWPHAQAQRFANTI